MWIVYGVENRLGDVRWMREEIDEQTQLVAPCIKAGCWQRKFHHHHQLSTLKLTCKIQGTANHCNKQDGGRVFISYQHLRPHPLTSSLS